MNSLCGADDQNGIVASDPQLRTATLQVTNNYPCAVSGYWQLSIPVGYAGDELGGEIRAYRQVGSAWQEVFGGQQVLVTIGAGQTLEVPLLLEGAGWSSDTAICATFHAVNLADEALASGLLPGYEAHDSLTLEVNTVDLCVGSMPEVYEDTLAGVIPMNRDYDDGYVDSNQNPLPDNTDPLPTGATPPPAHAGEDDLPAGSLTFPYGFHGTWTLTVPAGLRVWQWTGSVWAEVQSGTAYARSGGGGIGLRVEGLLPTSAAEYLTVSAQFTDTNDAPTGLPLTDRVKVEVVSVDLQIQNISEYDEATKPALVIVNDDYDEGNVHPISGEAVTDNGRLHDQIVSVAPGIVASDDDLVHGTLTIAGPSGQHGKWWIEVTGEPSTVDGAGDGPGEYPGYDQYLRVWLPDGTPVPTDPASALPITLNAQAVDLLIEGLAVPSQAGPIQLTAHFTPDGNYALAAVAAEVMDTTAATLIGGKLKSIDFTSDQGVLKKNPTEGSIWGDSAVPFETPQWVADVGAAKRDKSNPISQTMGTQVTATVIVRVEPAGIAFTLIGDAGINGFLDFYASGLVSTGGYQPIEVRAETTLPDHVCIATASINWKIETGTSDFAVGQSGVHKIYVTYGTPAGSAVTEKRLAFLCEAASGKNAITPCADAIYSALAGAPPTFTLDTKPLRCLWLMMDPAVKDNGGDCFRLASLMQLMCQMLGLGSGELGYVYATTDNDCYSTSATAWETRTCSGEAPGGTHGAERLEFFAGGALNKWEGVFKLDGWYYAVKETKSQTPLGIMEHIIGFGPIGGRYQVWVWGTGSDFQCHDPGPFPVPLPN